MRNREGLIWLTDERCYGEVIGPVGAYFTLIKYSYMGDEREVFIENDDFELIEEGEDIDD